MAAAVQTDDSSSNQPAQTKKGPDFSNPKKLGFMRVIIILYSITVLSALVSLILVSRDVVTYDTSMIVSMVETVVAAITIWMIVKRMRIARKVIIILNAIDIAIGIIFLAMELLDMTSFIGTVVTSALIIVYFATSRRVKAVMVNDFNAETVKDSGIPTMKDPAFWRNLILYYCIFSILGHWMEAGFCMLIRAGIVAGSYDPSNTSLWRDWLYPFPPDGVGFVACVLLLYPLKNWLQEHINSKWAPLVVSFIINALVCTLIEFCFGMVVNTQHQLWDYSDMAFNFMGQVVLQNSIGFGFASTVMTWAVYPALASQLNKLPKRAMSLVFWGFIAFYAMLQCLYLVNPPATVTATQDESGVTVYIDPVS